MPDQDAHRAVDCPMLSPNFRKNARARHFCLEVTSFNLAHFHRTAWTHLAYHDSPSPSTTTTSDQLASRIMFSSLTAAFGRFTVGSAASGGPSSFASASRLSSSSVGSLHMASSSRPTLPNSTSASLQLGSIRHKGDLAPRRTKYRKAHKITIPFNTGGSTKGTTVQEGAYGIRLLAPTRLSAKQLVAAETALKRKLKVVKGAQVFLRVFPDIPVCVKGNETRMGKGKGAFEYWACR